MSEEPKYTHTSYGMGFKLTRSDGSILVRPGWFARVFLRRKPKRIHPEDLAAGLGRAARRQEEKMIWDIFTK